MARPRSLVILSLVTALGIPAAAARTQSPPAPRSADLVPVSVYAVDRTGKPVIDLRQSDFTVLEDGVPQAIRQFAQQAFGAGQASPDAKPALRTGVAASPQDHRIFVFALGLGRLEAVSRGMTALIRFAKTQLLPQDQVAIFAYDRALPFTTDRQRVVDALERIKKAHEAVSFSIGQELGPMGAAALYGSRALPKKVQQKIDEMLFGPGAPPPALITSDQIESKAFGDLSLDSFMASCATSLQDLDNVMTLMEYLRRFDGEKHVIFVTENGFLWPSQENDESIATAANDARAAFHALQTGGQLAPNVGREMETTVQQAQSLQSLRRISSLTGGIASIMEPGQAMFDRLDGITRTGYLLEYQASNSGWEGNYRTIEVKVGRPDVTVLHRHGYYRATESGPFDRRGHITNTRLGAAASTTRAVTDIKVKSSLSISGRDTMEVKGKLELAKIKLAGVEGARIGVINVAAFGLDTGGNFMGMRTETISLKLGEEEYARALKDGFSYSLQMPVIPGAQQLRVIFYDFASDLLGRAELKIGSTP